MERGRSGCPDRPPVLRGLSLLLRLRPSNGLNDGSCLPPLRRLDRDELPGPGVATNLPRVGHTGLLSRERWKQPPAPRRSMRLGPY